MENLIAKNQIFKIVIEKDEPNGYHVWCPALPGCHSQGDTVQEARENITEAIQGYLETLISRKKSLPKFQNQEIWVENFNIPMPQNV